MLQPPEGKFKNLHRALQVNRHNRLITIVFSKTEAWSSLSKVAKCFWSSSLVLDGCRPKNKENTEYKHTTSKPSLTRDLLYSSLDSPKSLNVKSCTHLQHRDTTYSFKDTFLPSMLSQSLWSCCIGQLSHCWLWVFAFCCRAATENACFKVNMISSTLEEWNKINYCPLQASVFLGKYQINIRMYVFSPTLLLSEQ